MRLLPSCLRRLVGASCVACGTRPAPGGFCRACLDASGAAAHAATANGLPLFFVVAYHGAARAPTPLARSLVAFKDHGDRRAGRALAGLLAGTLGDFLPEGAAVVPVPADPARLRSRLANPAAWLARALARRGRRRLDSWLLRRRGGRAQRGLGGGARRANLEGAFALGRAVAPGYPVVIVDDVVTTGATLAAVIGTLEAAGAVPVAQFVLACADREIASGCHSRIASDGSHAMRPRACSSPGRASRAWSRSRASGAYST